jgi:hypothetical protein
MKLPTGATGFGDMVIDPATRRLRELGTICHHAARRTGGRVTSLAGPGATPNFYAATIAYEDDTIAVVRHGLLALLAVARAPGPHDVRLVWVERPGLAETLREVTELRVLTLAELLTDVNRADLSELRPSELEQIAYWKPETVGELLFHWWD